MWAGAAAMTLGIGFSRAYLGVHYPTDVMAGYLAAIAWTTLIRIAHRHTVHEDPTRRDPGSGDSARSQTRLGKRSGQAHGSVTPRRGSLRISAL